MTKWAGTANPTYRHGMSGTSVYNIWCEMVARCTRPTHARYADYGGRGIAVCERWRDFANFYADMGDRPPGLSIDRIDNDGNYEPGNCRWATSSQQVRNRRPQPSKFSQADRERMKALYESGLTYDQIAAEFGTVDGYVRVIVKRLGVTSRSPSARRILSPDQVLLAEHLLEIGVLQNEVGPIFGVRPRLIHRAILRARAEAT